MGLAEVRWLQSGKIVCNDHTLIYSGHKKDHKHGVGMLLSKVVSKSVLGYCALSNGIQHASVVRLLKPPSICYNAHY